MSPATTSNSAWPARLIAGGFAGARARWGVVHWRYGWCGSIALAILAAAAAVEIGKNQPLQAQLSALKLRASEPRRTPAFPPVSAAVTRAGEIEALLRSQAVFELQYRQLIEVAVRRGIELPRAEYVTTVDEPGGMSRVQVSFTVATRYPQFRSFVEEVLRTLPAASLDQFSVRRDNVAQAQVEVSFRMSFWAVRGPAATS